MEAGRRVDLMSHSMTGSELQDPGSDLRDALERWAERMGCGTANELVTRWTFIQSDFIKRKWVDKLVKCSGVTMEEIGEVFNKLK